MKKVIALVVLLCGFMPVLWAADGCDQHLSREEFRACLLYTSVFTVGSVHEGTIIEMLDKGAVVALPYGVEGFATPKHLVKEDGSQAQLDEKLEFKVIEFNKDAKRIILSHSRIFEDVAKAEERAEKKEMCIRDRFLSVPLPVFPSG